MKNNSCDQYLFLIAVLTVGCLFLGINPGVAQIINRSLNAISNSSDDNSTSTNSYNASQDNSINNSDNSTTNEETPAAPTGLTAVPGNGQVALSWTAGAGDVSYDVYVATVNGGPYQRILTGDSSRSFTVPNLTNGSTYYFVVNASDSLSNLEPLSPNSNQASATPRSISAIAQLFHQASTAINIYNSIPSSQNLTVAQAQVALLQPYNSVTLAMINYSSSTLGVYDAANRSLASVLFIHANTAISTYNSMPNSQNLTSAQGQIALLQAYNTITLAMINYSSSTLGVYDAANRSLASVLFIHANTAISTYNSMPNSQNLTSAQGQIALLQPYNTITLAMINYSSSTLGVYDAANRSLASVLFIHANTAISTYNSMPNSQNLTSAQGQIALLQAYNTITLAMINYSSSTLGVYDAANRSLASVLFIHANTAISTYNSMPNSQNLTSAQGQIALLQPYNTITLVMINYSSSTLGVYDAANRSLASVLFIHANTAISTYNNMPNSQNLTSAQGQIVLLQAYNTITLAMINFSSSTLGVYDAANRSLASVLFIHANTAISTYNSMPNSQNLTSAQGQIALLQPYNTITLAMINYSGSTVDVYDAANQSLVSVLYVYALMAIDTYNSTPSSQNLTSAQGQIALLQPYNNITTTMIGLNSANLGVYDQAIRELVDVMFMQAKKAIGTYNSSPTLQNVSSALSLIDLLQPYNYITLQMIGYNNSIVGVYDQALNDFLTAVNLNLQKVDKLSILQAPSTAQSFASAVAVYGNDLLVADPQITKTGSNSGGLINEYINSNNQWSFKYTIQPGDVQPNDEFGSSVVEDNNGNLLAVANNPASGSPSIYIFNNSNVTALDNNNNWVQEYKINLGSITNLSAGQLQGLSMAMDNGVLVFGLPAAQEVLVFNRTPSNGGLSGSWQYEATIVPNPKGTQSQFSTINFGETVDVLAPSNNEANTIIAVGAPNLGNIQYASRVIFYTPSTAAGNPYSNWNYAQPVTYSSTDPGFARQVGVGEYPFSIVVGDWSGNTQDPGKVLVYNSTTSATGIITWATTAQQLTVIAPLTGGNLGDIVKVNNNQMVIQVHGEAVTLLVGEGPAIPVTSPIIFNAVYAYNAAGDNNWDWQYTLPTTAGTVSGGPVSIAGKDVAVGEPASATQLQNGTNYGAVAVLSPIVNTCVPVMACSATFNCGNDSCGNLCGTCSSGQVCSAGTCQLASSETSSKMKIK